MTGAGGGASWRELCAEAAFNLRGQGRRSVLALLGVMIGSAAIIALLNLTHIAQLETLKRFQRMGIDMLEVRAAPVGPAPARLERAAIEALPGGDPDIVEAIPLAVGRAQVRAGALQADAMIAAAPPALFQTAALSPAAGRRLGPADACSLAVVLGAEIAEALSRPGEGAPLGRVAHIGGYGYTVVGVLPSIVFEPLSPVNYDGAVIIPLSCARRVLPGPDPTAALIRLREGADPDVVSARIVERLANPTASLQARSARNLVEAFNQHQAVHGRLLAGVGSISLLVGGIGVLNVMLMTVMERRREIGLRAAVGATPGEIRLMFLIEAVILSVAGGAVGALLGLAVTALIAAASGWSFAIALWVLPLGPGMAALVGVIFGLHPALAASRIDPIEALRAE